MAKVLAKGALRQVEEIRILRSYELTMRAVSVLLEQCPNLHILAEMDGWEGISQIELLQLRKKIREENLDLDTFIAWSVTGWGKGKTNLNVKGSFITTFEMRMISFEILRKSNDTLVMCN